MKKFIAIAISLALAIGIVIGVPLILKDQSQIQANIKNETSLVNQEILSYSNQENTYNKIYANGKLIGNITDLDYFNNKLSSLKYDGQLETSELGLIDDVFIAKEKTFCELENVDDDIIQYLYQNNLLGIKTTAVEFSTTDGVYEIIYVNDIEDFYEARDEFLLNFISENTLKKLRNKEQILGPNDIGTVEMKLDLLETITYKDAIVAPNRIFNSVDEIYNFLCYGRNNDREYYTVREGDTLQSFYKYFGILDKQIVSINKDILKSANQIITPGMQINVTYFTSPITVNVTKQVLQQESITPEVPEYIEDESLEAGKVEVITQESNGSKNVLYEEHWTNGVLQDGQVLSETITKQPIRGKIAVGTKLVKYVGTGNYAMPIDFPYITTDFGGYFGHTGTDFINRYGIYTSIYAVDSGVVDEKGWKDDMGWYVMIDHQNGIRTFYMHLKVPAFVEVGENVSRGQVIGQEGNSGMSEGAHVHVTFEVKGERVNACKFLDCASAR